MRPLSTIFQLYHVGRFIGGGNWNTFQTGIICIVNDAFTLEKEESEEAEGTISRPASPVAKEETPAEGEPPGLVTREGN